MITMADYWPNLGCALWSHKVCVCVEGEGGELLMNLDGEH